MRRWHARCLLGGLLLGAMNCAPSADEPTGASAEPVRKTKDPREKGETSPARNAAPYGAVGPIERGYVQGWALDPDAEGSIAVHFYVDGPAGSGVFAGWTIADLPLASSAAGRHGFRFPLPKRFRDGRDHTVWVHAINEPVGVNPLVSKTPASFRISRLEGVLDRMQRGTLRGWAVAPDVPSANVSVRIAIDEGPADTVSANVPSAGVNPATEPPGDHAFVYEIPPWYRDGRLHTIRAYAVDPLGDAETEIDGSPARFAFGEGVELAGAEQIVYDGKDSDLIPDLPARAFRDASGKQVQLLVTHHVSQRLVGPDLDHLALDPTAPPILTSGDNGAPASYDDREWIGAVYAENESDVYALVHMEYEGHRHGTCGGYATVGLKGDANGGPPATASRGDAYVIDETTGGWSAFERGDIVEHDGSGWRKIVANAGGHVPRGTRVVFAASAGARANRMATASGAGTWSLVEPQAGWSVYVDNPKSVYAQSSYAHLISPPRWELKKKGQQGIEPFCQRTSLTQARSFDGGKTYVHETIDRKPLTPEAQVVATLPLQYVGTGAVVGYMEPTNIVRTVTNAAGQPVPAPPGATNVRYYALVHTEELYGAGGLLQPWGACLFRTSDLARPSWRAVDAHGKETRFIDPYSAGEPANPKDFTCEPVSRDAIMKMSNSLTWNTHLQAWLLVGRAQRGGEAGFFYSVSKDLVRWSDRKLIAWMVHDENKALRHLYPSVIDPKSPSRNFETSGQEPYLYFTRNNGGMDRDLIRLVLRFE